jgi:hypothetical protein
VNGRLAQAATFGGAAAAMGLASLAAAALCPGTCAGCATCAASLTSMGSAVGAVGIAVGGSLIVRRGERRGSGDDPEDPGR